MLICFDGRHVPDSSMPIVEPDGERLAPLYGRPKQKEPHSLGDRSI